MVSSLVVSNAHMVPEGVDTKSTHDNVGVVELVVMADPCSDKSPESLPHWISTESTFFNWLSTYSLQCIINIIFGGYDHLPIVGLFQRFLGASLAVKGVKFFSTVLEMR